MANAKDPGDAADAWSSMPLDLDVDVEPLALSSRLPQKRQQALFELPTFFWKFFAAGDPTSPAQILDCLSLDEAVAVRRRVAQNENTPVDALALLVEDSDASVRAAVAHNRSTPLFLLRRLARDASTTVRFAIAANPEMPDAILLSLFLDPDPFVAERASQSLAT